jgi:hypothetical protein
MGDGKNLKKVLDSYGVRISNVSEATKIPATTLYSIVQRDAPLKHSYMDKIAEYLGLNWIEFYGKLKLASYNDDPAYDWDLSSDGIYTGDMANIYNISTKIISEDSTFRGIFFSYLNLNEEGKLEAMKRIEELSEIKKYTNTKKD